MVAWNPDRNLLLSRDSTSDQMYNVETNADLMTTNRGISGDGYQRWRYGFDYEYTGSRCVVL